MSLFTTDEYVQPKITVPGKHVALEPIPVEAAEKQIVNGVLKVKQRGSLVALKVIFGNANFREGQRLYIRADRNVSSIWGKEIFEVEGKRFILVPEEEVLLAEKAG